MEESSFDWIISFSRVRDNEEENDNKKETIEEIRLVKKRKVNLKIEVESYPIDLMDCGFK